MVMQEGLEQRSPDESGRQNLVHSGVNGAMGALERQYGYTALVEQAPQPTPATVAVEAQIFTPEQQEPAQPFSIVRGMVEQPQTGVEDVRAA